MKLSEMSPAHAAMYCLSGQMEADRDESRHKKQKVNQRADAMHKAASETIETMDRFKESKEATS